MYNEYHQQPVMVPHHPSPPIRVPRLPHLRPSDRSTHDLAELHSSTLLVAAVDCVYCPNKVGKGAILTQLSRLLWWCQLG